ncbi:hypothetical protein FOCC_FOCC009028 [Frankliniella occidentalis]|nr:hypothetical protein FOCC_FOCC009028 [Frankliniella occidentalis]
MLGQFNLGKVTLADGLEQSEMAGPDPPEAANIKGIWKYYNSTTEAGRAGAAKITLAAMGLALIYFTMKPKAKPATK